MIELISVISTLLCVWLTTKVNILSWPVGIVAIIGYSYIFYTKNLYYESALQIVFLIQSIYGWYYWKRKDNIKPHMGSIKTFLKYMFCVLILSIPMIYIMDKYTNNPDPASDTITTLLSIVGMIYLIKKDTLNWLIWTITNVFFVHLFINQQMWWSAGLYTILLALSIKGLREWTK